MNLGLIECGKKYLITTDNWFYAPDGQQYNAVHGTVKGVRTDDQLLGIKTNRGSANWYVEIGNMFVAGCQIHYTIRSDECHFGKYIRELDYEGEVKLVDCVSRIYDADEIEV